MIERIVLIKLKEAHANDEGRRRVVAHARRVLPLVPGVVSCTVGAPADEAARDSWDISFIVRFERLVDVATYDANEDHRALVDEFLEPIVEVKKAWNFDVGDNVDG